VGSHGASRSRWFGIDQTERSGSVKALRVAQLKGRATALCGCFISRPGDSGEAVIRARFRDGWERSMAKIRISSTELVWIFHQRLEAFYDCPPEVPIAIVPDDGSWMAVKPAQIPLHRRRPSSIAPQGFASAHRGKRSFCPLHGERIPLVSWQQNTMTSRLSMCARTSRRSPAAKRCSDGCLSTKPFIGTS